MGKDDDQTIEDIKRNYEKDFAYTLLRCERLHANLSYFAGDYKAGGFPPSNLSYQLADAREIVAALERLVAV